MRAKARAAGHATGAPPATRARVGLRRGHRGAVRRLPGTTRRTPVVREGPRPGASTPGPAPATSRTAALLRRALWWCVLTLTGGVERRGHLPRGGCVVVANHSSHADTAALLAALDSRHTPAIGAAADYWFASPWRSTICRRLAAGFPVRRTGGGMDDLLATAGALRAGRAVVLFPEGTRGEGGVGSFHRGALVLAERAGVPVVPVGIAGTDRLLPKHGRLRSSLVRVRIGAPLPSLVTPEEARAAVAALHGRTNAESLRDSRSRRRVAAVVTSRWGLPIAFLWAFAEALSWPLMPELLLAVACVAVPRAALRLSVGALAGSLAGSLLALQLAGVGVQMPAPLTTDRMRAQVRQELTLESADAVRHQPWNGIPFKVYAAEGGRADVPPGSWLTSAAAARGSRTLTVGLVCAALGLLLRRHRRFYGSYLVVLGAGFTLGLSLIVSGWQ